MFFSNAAAARRVNHGGMMNTFCVPNDKDITKRVIEKDVICHCSYKLVYLFCSIVMIFAYMWTITKWPWIFGIVSTSFMIWNTTFVATLVMEMFGSIGMFLDNYYPLLVLLSMMLLNIFASFMTMVDLTVQSESHPLQVVIGGVEISIDSTELITALFGFTAAQLMFAILCSQIVFKIQTKTLRRNEYRRELNQSEFERV